MSENTNKNHEDRHKEWMSEERPQTFKAIYNICEGDSEDLKSCSLRLEGEVQELQTELKNYKKFAEELYHHADHNGDYAMIERIEKLDEKK
jgi:hypothetical protein